MRNIPAVLRIVWDAGPAAVVWGCGLRIVAGVVPPAILFVTRWIIDQVVGYRNGGRHLAPHFWWFVALEFGLASLAALLARGIVFTDTLLADKYIRYISLRVMKHAASMDLATYEDPDFNDQLERARVQATDRLMMIQMVGNLLQQAIVTVTLAASILAFAPWIVGVLVVFVIPAFLGDSHFAFLGYALNFRLTPIRRELDYLRTLGSSKESAKELKLFSLSTFLSIRYRELSDYVYEENVALAGRKLRLGALLSFVQTAGYYAAYAYVIYRTLTGALTIGTLTLLAGAIAGATTNIQALFSTFSGIADQALFLTDLLAFFAVRPTIASAQHAIPAPRPIVKGFDLQNVSFSYPGAARLVLDDLSLRIEPSERIALIGENGQGKTTLVKLLTRLYDPTAGRILLDGVDLREYDLEDLRSQIGVIFQDFMRYDMTAAENIAVGQIGELHNQGKIERAAAKSGVDKVIRKFQSGYDQMLGRRFEGGLDISGGEWQKLALSRAYLREAQLLILDEPTASLDARAEHDVFTQFAELTAGKMALLISHRFSTVRMTDRILVLDGGRITEQGSHHQLVASGGRYAEMFELQAANYR